MYVFDIFFDSPKKIWSRLLILIIIIFLSLMVYKHFYGKPVFNEGFTQNGRFVLKHNTDIYDDFYVNIYESINPPAERTSYEIKSICDITQASEKSVFLDIGSGTGYLVNELTDLGFQSYGLDKSKAMIAYSEKKYSNAAVKCGDVLDSMSYDKSTFSHVLCLYFTIYEIADKSLFFKNCYFWLQSGGYLILHLVDEKKYNPIKQTKDMRPYERSNNNIKNEVSAAYDYNDFKYKTVYNSTVQTETNKTITETFIDSQTENIRQNEMNYFMEPVKDIINMSRKYGFIPHGCIDLSIENGDKNQYIYFLERTM
jgi:SAM-dependent methyltransferase